MMYLRRNNERGHARFDWLESRHSFSFASYYDPAHMGVSVLRVINDDIVAPGAGFDAHPHRDMEIISYVLQGSIEHRDTLGSHRKLSAGEVQVMSAGTGVEHSEYNVSEHDSLHFLQIWITPNAKGLTPRYQQQPFEPTPGLQLLIAPADDKTGADNANTDADADVLSINQDARMYRVQLDGQDLELPQRPNRVYYLHVIEGQVSLQGETLKAGDAAAVNTAPLVLSGAQSLHALLFDLPA
ncbi:pirin family protein [Cobetia crustatorum]|uniref:Pirin family protein n=1 Tax=Cobetia crustatorum TaxID=553385 RepID=A0A558HQ18_9GAMM|nr:pirin family protein [Cobetia crustatorum]TVU71224.1 pirin family protein [Cobetia crustatorum]